MNNKIVIELKDSGAILVKFEKPQALSNFEIDRIFRLLEQEAKVSALACQKPKEDK